MTTPLLTRDQAAALLNVSVTSLDRLTRAGRIPVVRVTTRSVRFRLTDVEAFIHAQVVDHQPMRAPRAASARRAAVPVLTQPGRVRHLWEVPDPLRAPALKD